MYVCLCFGCDRHNALLLSTGLTRRYASWSTLSVDKEQSDRIDAKLKASIPNSGVQVGNITICDFVLCNSNLSRVNNLWTSCRFQPLTRSRCHFELFLYGYASDIN